MRFWTMPLLLAACAVVVCACSPGEETSAPQVLDSPKALDTSADPMQQWHAISEGVLGEMNIDQAMELTRQIAEGGPDKLEPIFAVLDAKEKSPSAKVLAVICLGTHVNESHLQRLIALTQPEHDAVTRGCAINLLAMISSPAGDARIKELLNDPDAHVSKESALVLLRRDDDTAVQKAVSLWKDPATEDKDRNEIVLAFPTSRAQDYLFIYEEAICNQGIDYIARSHAVNIVGMLGDQDSSAKIDACLNSENMPQIREALEGAKKAILSRTGQPLESVPVNVPQ